MSFAWTDYLCQSRLTEKGQQFTMYKFRTMRNDAEAKSGAVWARRNDPRVTSIGAFLMPEWMSFHNWSMS